MQLTVDRLQSKLTKLGFLKLFICICRRELDGETGAQGQFPICQTTTSDNCHATSASQLANLLVGSRATPCS